MQEYFKRAYFFSSWRKEIIYLLNLWPPLLQTKLLKKHVLAVHDIKKTIKVKLLWLCFFWKYRFTTALWFSPILRWKSDFSLSKAVSVCFLKKLEPKKRYLTDTGEFSHQIFGLVQILRLKSNCSLSKAVSEGKKSYIYSICNHPFCKQSYFKKHVLIYWYFQYFLVSLFLCCKPSFDICYVRSHGLITS